MKKIYFVTIFYFLLFQDFYGYSQRGYFEGHVVLNAGDTLYGIVKDRHRETNPRLYKKIKFKDNKGKKRSFGPEEIQGYGRDGQVFRSLSFNKAERFLGYTEEPESRRQFFKIIVTGYMTLYEREFVNFDCGSTYDSKPYLKRINELHFTPVPVIGFRKKMKFYFSDSYDMVKAIEQKKYKYKHLQSLVADYNKRYEKN